MNEIRTVRFKHAVSLKEQEAQMLKHWDIQMPAENYLSSSISQKLKVTQGNLYSHDLYFYPAIWHNKEPEFSLFPPHTRQTAKRAFEMLKAIANYILTSLTPRYHYIGPVRKTFSKTMGTE